MTNHIKSPTLIEAAGTGGKLIREFIGRVNSGDENVSVARMTSPQGWSEPAQTPEFDEITLVLSGAMHITAESGTIIVKANEAYYARAGITLQYATPDPEGAEYVAICLPAFSPDTVHREDEE